MSRMRNQNALGAVLAMRDPDIATADCAMRDAWKPAFRPINDNKGTHFEDRSFQYVVDRIEGSNLEDITAYLIACTQRLRALGQGSEFHELCVLLQRMQGKYHPSSVQSATGRRRPKPNGP